MKFEVDSTIESSETYDYSSIENIATENASELTYQSFYTNYMLPNIPCIIKGVSENWECTRLWLTEDKNINFNYLEEQYGLELVQVYSCNERFYNTQRCYSSCFKDFLNQFSQDSTDVKSLLSGNEYVKNWHLKLNYPEDNFYEVPIFFASDWLNEFYIGYMADDYRFVYVGPTGSWTPFHCDVFSSYSWSVNVCGVKKWLMVPPGDEQKTGNVPYDLLSVSSSCSSQKNYIEVIQNPGEAIFVPSNWYHQVHNLAYSISINHNWINGCNIKNMCTALIKCLADVKHEIQDCSDMEDFEEHCQLMLDSCFGMDYKTFYQFLKYIAAKRMEMINNYCSKVLFHGHEIGNNHIIFDLKALKNTLCSFMKCEELNVLEWYAQLDITPQNLLEQIVSTLEIYDCTKYQV